MTRTRLLLAFHLLLSVSGTHRVGKYRNGNEDFISGTGGNGNYVIGSGKRWGGWLSGFDSSSKSPTRNGVTRGEECDRPCDGSPPRTCYYRWVVERYSVLGPACRECRNGVTTDCLKPQCVLADGFQRAILTVNRQIGGPSIQVCRGDILAVEVDNRIADGVTSIHWHGFRQIGTPYMDGVPMVTQCPIQPFTRFLYTFQAAESRTFFWHSHQGSQKLGGLTGPLIVRDVKDREVHGHLYDEDLSEHVIFFQDWTHRTAEEYVPGLHNPNFEQLPDAVLINGRGRLSRNGTNSTIPVTTFNVQAGKCYRFRLVSGTCMTCAYALKISGHRLLAISADGGLNFKATPVDSIAFNSADRFDFILEANQSSGSYNMFVQSVNSFCNNLRQVAVLQYTSSENGTASLEQLGNSPMTGDLGVILNLPNSTCSGNNGSNICVSMLKGVEHAPVLGNTRRPYTQYHITFGAYLYNVDDLFTPMTYQRYEEPTYERLVEYLANNVSFKFPSSPMLSQWNDIPDSDLCSRDCFDMNRQKPCSCATAFKVPYGSIVDLLVIDTGERDGFDHAFHLHGYNFYVLEMGIFKSEKEARQKEVDEISLRASRDDVDIRTRPQRDTISIPARGYALLRFIADNPGKLHEYMYISQYSQDTTTSIWGNRSNISSPLQRSGVTITLFCSHPGG